jgi:DNA-binding NarL/FixJ family response regulator
LAQQIILADTQVIFRTGAARVLGLESDLEVVALCADLTELMEAIENRPGSVAVFPTSIGPDINEILDAVELAGSKSVLILERAGVVAPSIARRVDGVVLRSVGGPQLSDCLRRVAAGERCVNRDEVKKTLLLDRVGARVLQRLTPRELQIVALVTEGGKNKQIAEQLGTKEQVIKNYLRTIYDKTGVSDRLELMVFTQHHRTLADAAVRVRQELQLSA